MIHSYEADSSRAHQALTDAEAELERVKNERTTAEGDIAEIFNIHGFGADGEWKKLDGTCLETEVGEWVYLSFPSIYRHAYCGFDYSYTYEVCLFNEAKQKPNHGGQTFSLGSALFTIHFTLVLICSILTNRKYDSWNPSPDVKPGEPEYYQKQVYKHGARCWNGPERSVVVSA